MDSTIWTPPNIPTNPDISFRLTYTEAIDALPPGRQKERIQNWQSSYKTEWRWRFIKFHDGQSDRHVIETSYLTQNQPRVYLNKYGNWVSDIEVNEIYDHFVAETYYLYTTS